MEPHLKPNYRSYNDTNTPTHIHTKTRAHTHTHIMTTTAAATSTTAMPLAPTFRKSTMHVTMSDAIQF